MGLPNEHKTEFGKNSALYDEARPTYPQMLADNVIRISGVPDDGRVLDIGCGSGKATILFGERGYPILGVDFSEELVAIARQKSAHLPNISYLIGELEHVNLPRESFDLMVSGQALHWIKPGGYEKIYGSLKDSGMLAAFWNFEDPEKSDLVLQVRELYLQHCPTFPPDLGSSKRFVKKIDASGLFEPVEINTYYWDCELSKDKYVKLANSWSWASSLPTEDLEELLTDISKLLEGKSENLSIPFRTVLLTTKKKVK